MTGKSELQVLQIDYSPKPIPCTAFTPALPMGRPSLIFTQGAGGTLSADAVVNFSSGFASVAPILCFQGNSNLKSRVKMFAAVAENQNFSTALGGRSMGARAAVVAITGDTKHLVLVSYPLHNLNDTRDQILLDLPASVQVLFISGDNDSMCDLKQLDDVRSKMKCDSWKITVKNATHGMVVKPKIGTEEVGKKTGEIAARWLEGSKEKDCREGEISWNAGESEVMWSGWLACSSSSQDTKLPSSSKRKHPNRHQETSQEQNAAEDCDDVSTRTRRRQKP